MKYKVGDKIILLEDKYGIPKGHVMTTSSVDDETSVFMFCTKQDDTDIDTSWAWYRSDDEKVFTKYIGEGVLPNKTSEFKVGDIVKKLDKTRDGSFEIHLQRVVGRKTGKVTKVDGVEVDVDGDYFYESDLELLETNNVVDNNIKNVFTNMFEKFKLSLKPEPQKSFIKAGITNRNDEFTSEGKDIFLAWLLEKHGDEFKKEVVDPILKEAKEDK